MEPISPEATGANAVPLGAHLPRRTAYERPASRIDGVDTSLVTEARLVDLECQVRRLTDAFQAETHEDMRTAEAIKQWLRGCIEHDRFCPREAGTTTLDSNVCCYITSSGDDDAASIYRINKLKMGEDVFTAVGNRIKEVYGLQLNDSCHMGPDASVYANGLRDLVQWEIDFRRIVGENMFASKTLLLKLGIHSQVPGLENWASDSVAPEFVRTFKLRNGEEDGSTVAIGVNCWSLLLVTSLSQGYTLHPKIANDFSRSVLGEVMSHAPLAATPSSKILVRGFDLYTTGVEHIPVSREGRPDHFLRPTNDPGFAVTGVFNIARAIDQYLPEDALHCGFLLSLASTLKCDPMEVPGNIVYAPYELLPDRYYAVWINATKTHGTLRLDSRHKAVSLSIHESDESVSVVAPSAVGWEATLRDMNAILPPMIWRAGACVVLDNAVGLLVPHGEERVNFDPVDCTYQVLIGEAGHHVHLAFWEALAALIPAGTALGLRLDSSSGQSLAPKVPRCWQDRTLIQVRLNVPPMAQPDRTKVYVSYAMRPHNSNVKSGAVSMDTVAVDPWELELLPDSSGRFEEQEGQEPIPFLSSLN